MKKRRVIINGENFKYDMELQDSVFEFGHEGLKTSPLDTGVFSLRPRSIYCRGKNFRYPLNALTGLCSVSGCLRTD